MNIESQYVSIGGLMILTKDNQVLLLKKAKDHKYAPGSYTVPSGSKEPKESPLDSAIRETKEEVGVIVAPEDAKLVHVTFRGKTNGEEWADFFFSATKWKGEPKLMEPHKCDEVAWFDLDALPDKIIPFVKQALTFYQQGILYSEFSNSD